MPLHLTDQRVLVMGLGRFGGGVGVTRFLAGRGARVTVTDLEPADKLAHSLARLADLNVTYRLGGHDECDFASADLVVVNPAVDPRGNKFLAAAAAAGVPTTSEIRLLAASLPNRQRTIGITGSAGKSTTTAMIGHILRKTLGPAPGPGGVHVGGNLGGSLLENLDAIAPDAWVVLELSSFMLEGLDLDHWSPHVAVVTNLTNNHLDRHGTIEAYTAAKQAILRHQKSCDLAILGTGVADWPVATGVSRTIVAERDYGIPLLLPGLHNQINAMTAVIVCSAIGIDPRPGSAGPPGGQAGLSQRGRGVLNGGPEPLLTQALADFPGLDHRLQFVAEHAGVRYFNDSKATTPEAAMLALRSFAPGIVHIILGGYDKKADLSELARMARAHGRGVYTIGKTGDAMAALAEAAPGPAVVVRCGTLPEAMAAIAQSVRPGDAVVLSPACASWDQFENFEQRGAAFIAMVAKTEPGSTRK